MTTPVSGTTNAPPLAGVRITRDRHGRPTYAHVLALSPEGNLIGEPLASLPLTHVTETLTVDQPGQVTMGMHSTHVLTVIAP